MSPAFRHGAQIRREFLDFFAERGHAVVPAASLVPDDATLMFTNAGMVPFKNVFTGVEKRPYSRAASCQKCLRVSGKHNDLEEVGRTPRHHTLFEMLGNFSFGDYFKEEAIDMAWALVVGHWGVDPGKLWVSVHHSDDEAYDLWTRKIGMPAARVIRLGDKDNFWSMGDTGPCGPCTEIHVDLGDSMGPAHPEGPGGGGNRYMEIWNNVFMQFVRHPDGSMDPLPRPSVDTGMGLERIASVLQGVTSNYDSDLLRQLMADGAEIGSVAMGRDEATDTALRVLADHSRACAFLVADGIIPTNEGRGYVLRRIARRAIRFGVRLGLGKTPFFHRLTDRVVEHFGGAYPELVQRRGFIDHVLRTEEERFAETRDKGLALLDEEMGKGGRILPGDLAFRLHDTFGFPLDLTRLIAAERGVGVDEAGFDRLMEAQREAGRAAWKGSGAEGTDAAYAAMAGEGLQVAFEGYTSLHAEGAVVALLHEGQRVPSLPAGARGQLVTDRTPFYGESGGQVGDTGLVTAPGLRLSVTDTQKPADGLVVHHVTVEQGSVAVGDLVRLEVAGAARADTRRNHSATHLLHAALRRVLGDHVMQKGSLVEPRRLRFDFSHFQAVSPAELAEIEDLVNGWILENVAVDHRIMDLDQARAEGAMAMFGEKYGARVRVIRMGAHSMELCGGTHVERTGDIGLFSVTAEGGVSSGVRRIEATTGRGALAAMRGLRQAAEAAADRLHVKPTELTGAVEKLQGEVKALRKELEDARRADALAGVDGLLATARDVGGIKVLAARTEGGPELLREQADKLRDSLGSGVVVLGTAAEGKVSLLVAVSKDLAGSRVHAGKLVGALAAMVGGKGGGRPDFAQAGGTQPEHLDAALAAACDRVAAG
ncbi:alanine--tRNA ligase [Myxococcota bacterium]|nr:alanine--tRNA ligase [Myxococcota bacterium]